MSYAIFFYSIAIYTRSRLLVPNNPFPIFTLLFISVTLHFWYIHIGKPDIISNKMVPRDQTSNDQE